MVDLPTIERRIIALEGTLLGRIEAVETAVTTSLQQLKAVASSTPETASAADLDALDQQLAAVEAAASGSKATSSSGASTGTSPGGGASAGGDAASTTGSGASQGNAPGQSSAGSQSAGGTSAT